MTATTVTHPVVLVTSDGVESDIECAGENTILAAAAEAGLILPSACKAGGCGACTAHLVSGRVEMSDHDDEVVDPPESEGGILLCSSSPREACRIELPYSREKVATTPPATRTATISALDRVSPAAMRVVLRLHTGEDGAGGADFVPGQFVTLSVPGTDESRSYSMANLPNWESELEFFVRLLPSGVMSDYLRERAAIGDELAVEGPTGAFELKENGLRPRFFLAGGTGLSPLLSMLRRMAEWGDPQPVRIFHGVGTDGEVFGEVQLAEAGAMLPDFAAATCVWRPGDDGPSPIDTAVAALDGMSELPDVYVCGPPSMIDTARSAFTAAGLPPAQFITEIFAAS